MKLYMLNLSLQFVYLADIFIQNNVHFVETAGVGSPWSSWD